MTYRETPLLFRCGDDRLVGIAAVPEACATDTGVLIVVGGPQYRAGSHRQFTLQARHLASHGIASLRFDYRGMGDSEGDMRSFEAIGDDLRAALDALFAAVPTLRSAAVWGLCDAASAALMYAAEDPRISRLVLLNPWAHTEQGAARARLKHYYLARLAQSSFWEKLLSGKMNLTASFRDLIRSTRHSPLFSKPDAPQHHPRYGASGRPAAAHFIDRMLDGLQSFRGRVLFILSGNDLTAREFIDLVKKDKRWNRACSAANVAREEIPEANHTFSSHAWRDQVAALTLEWLADG